jgi:hypothetical protein
MSSRWLSTHFLIDLYWVGRLGTKSVAAVGIAGNLTFIVLALSQMLGVGTTTVVSHAAGRKDHPQAQLMFNQSQLLSMLTGIMFTIVGLALTSRYANAMSPDPETRLGQELSALVHSSDGTAIRACCNGRELRGVGNFAGDGRVHGECDHQHDSAPFLISVGDGHAFGVAGAAISSLPP